MARTQPDAVQITSATRSHSDDLGARQRRYLISMGIRTACFVLAAVSAMTGTGVGRVLMWFFIFGAIFLPYVAVVLANVGLSDAGGGLDGIEPDATLLSLEGPSEPTPDPRT